MTRETELTANGEREKEINVAVRDSGVLRDGVN